MNPYDPKIYMIRAQLDSAQLNNWIRGRNIYGGKPPDLGYALHKLLAELFGAIAPRPYRVKSGGAQGRLTLYGYSPANADALRQFITEFAAPSQMDVIPSHTIESKPMPIMFEEGRRLGYEIHIRPMRRSNRNIEVDAAVSPIDDDGNPTHPNRKPAEAYAFWLKRRLEANGAKMTSAKIMRAGRAWAIRTKNAKPKLGPAATMSGELTVINPKIFAQAIAQGIGRHKAYGYGMIMLHPPQRPPDR